MAIKLLREYEFVHEGVGAFPLWQWVIASIMLVLVIGMFGNWSKSKMVQEKVGNPFLMVSNRQFSLFLWQNSEYMKAHVKGKTGYLPGFQSVPKGTPAPNSADDYAAAPPELLFLFHTWNRLIGDYVISNPIPREEFREFLAFDEQWLPHNWSGADFNYRQMIVSLPQMETEDLQALSEVALPTEVRQAFWGWKNYVKEGEKINTHKITVAEMNRFLQKYPRFSRSYWQNLFPHYLRTFTGGHLDTSAVIPEEDLAPFLRVACYRFAQEGQRDLRDPRDISDKG